MLLATSLTCILLITLLLVILKVVRTKRAPLTTATSTAATSTSLVDSPSEDNPGESKPEKANLTQPPPLKLVTIDSVVSKQQCLDDNVKVDQCTVFCSSPSTSYYPSFNGQSTFYGPSGELIPPVSFSGVPRCTSSGLAYVVPTNGNNNMSLPTRTRTSHNQVLDSTVPKNTGGSSSPFQEFQATSYTEHGCNLYCE